jgi:hypothetical protein
MLAALNVLGGEKNGHEGASSEHNQVKGFAKKYTTHNHRCKHDQKSRQQAASSFDVKGGDGKRTAWSAVGKGRRVHLTPYLGGDEESRQDKKHIDTHKATARESKPMKTTYGADS